MALGAQTIINWELESAATVFVGYSKNSLNACSPDAARVTQVLDPD